MIHRAIALVTSLVLLANAGNLFAQSASTSSQTGSTASTTKRSANDHSVVIQVESIHCKTCAKRLARKLFAVPGVKKVKANVDKNFATVYPESNKQLSVVKLWEAAEAAKFKVVSLETPTELIEKKPVSSANLSTSAPR